MSFLCKNNNNYRDTRTHTQANSPLKQKENEHNYVPNLHM